MKKIALFVALIFCLQLTTAVFTGAAENIVSEKEETVYNMNFGWKFKKADVSHPMAEAMASMVREGKEFYMFSYDDSDWEDVSIPHAVNALDSFDNQIKDAGEASLFRGYMMYRKSFTLNDVKDKKFILEFEAVRQTVYLYVNESFVGYYEAGTAPIGFDISTFVKEGENLIGVVTDNCAYRGAAFTTSETLPGNTPGDHSGWGYQWNTKDFNEVQGGITGNVNMYVTGLIYQTRPLYNNLKTTGNYIYPSEFNFEEGSARINVRAEVRNETENDINASLMVSIKDGDKVISNFTSPVAFVKKAEDGHIVIKNTVPMDAYSENPLPTSLETVDVTYIEASEVVENLTFWSVDNPYLYDVYTTLVVNGKAVDTQKITTGFREVIFDIENGGLLINGESTYLKGYAQRSTNEWAVIGVANDWLSDYDMELIRKSGSNFIRWMHVSPKPVAIRAGDKYGVVSVCPAGDKEGDVQGRSWDMRVEAMRDAIIYFRNSPSVIFYEAGNNAISPEHMQEMTDLRKALDPSGYRFMGCRTITSVEQLAAAEWVGTMIYRHDAAAKASMYQMGKHLPIIETEYKRDEAPRRVWDDFSPPDFDYVNKFLGPGAKKTDGYDIWDMTQEDMCVALASDGDGYGYFYHNRIGGRTGNDYYAGAAMMVWADSNMHGRNAGSENCRTTGRVDAVRLEKESFYAMQAMQSEGGKIHIVGHWNYPENTEENYTYNEKVWNGTYWEYTENTLRRDPTDKTVFVIGTELCDRVELYINGTLKGECKVPSGTFVFEFPHIDVTESGTISAIAYSSENKIIGFDKIETAGEAKRLKLTAYTGPEGLRGDGSDICYIDVETVDENGNLCPVNYDKVSFTIEGDGKFLGGYNSGKFDSESVIGKDYCFLECGRNRVFVQSLTKGGSFTLTARAENLEEAKVTVEVVPFTVTDGLTLVKQQSYEKNTYKETTTLFDKVIEANLEGAKPREIKENAIYCRLENVATGKMLDAKGDTLALTDTPSNATWKLIEAGINVYNLQYEASKKMIDVPGLSREAGIGLIVYAPNGGDNQKWEAVYDKEGYVVFVSKSSALALEAGESGIIQNNITGNDNQRWKIVEIEQKDEYKVTVNGKEVSFKTAPYRPDSSTGVVCEIRPVLDALGVKYTYSEEGKVVLTITESGAVIKEGETTIAIGNEQNLTNAEFYVENGEIIAEIAPVLNYTENVSVKTDEEEKELIITK